MFLIDSNVNIGGQSTFCLTNFIEPIALDINVLLFQSSVYNDLHKKPVGSSSKKDLLVSADNYLNSSASIKNRNSKSTCPLLNNVHFPLPFTISSDWIVSWPKELLQLKNLQTSILHHLFLYTTGSSDSFLCEPYSLLNATDAFKSPCEDPACEARIIL